ncbi:hypothetical protein OBBRIDRAFT_791899 [Obba rivulosa]|uniref:AB hydrolase-1 domain-containing protein n=1 Tax=Obba rivulosa TaxID=1052685 RepID=A0A8E2AZ43_9APHY|nr:hypothetical protein OBBRIDRAFT_791899 [Obba rivulosa]
MPSAPVDEQGTQLLYHDSGPPESSNNYATLVIFHGTVFHSENFKPMLCHAPENNMRIILVNLRSYPGSSPFSPEEVDIMRGSDVPSMASLLQARGMEAATFLSWIIEHEKLPPLAPADANGMGLREENVPQTGGVAILGWSSGAAIPFSLIANADQLPVNTRELLGRYLRTCVLWDPASYAAGCVFPPIEELYCPLRDPALTPDEIAPIFSLWVSSYFDHDLTMLDSLESATSFSSLLSGISTDPIPDPPPHQTPTTETFSPDQFLTNVDIPGAIAYHVPYLFMNREVYEANARSALQEKTIWPHLKMVLVWCDMSVGETLLGSWRIIDLANKAGKGRGLVIHRMRGANHFPHWNEAKRSVELLAELI